MSHFCFCFCLWFSLGSKLAAVKLNVEKKQKTKSHNDVAHQCGKISERQPRWHVEFTKWQRWVLQNKRTNCGAVTTGTWSSHIPEQCPSPQSTRCRQCSGKPPSSFCSWWRRSKRQGAPRPGRIGDNPCGVSCWLTCMSSWGGGASTAPSPSLLDTSALENCGGGQTQFQCVLICQNLTYSNYLLISIFFFLYCFHRTCVTVRSGVPGLTLADRLSSLRQATLPVSAALPPAGRRLLSSITILTLVSFTALTTVGLTLRQTQTMNTSGAWGKRKDREKAG